jgi:DNA-binding response OmpR family regulator
MELDENLYEVRLNGTLIPTSATEFRLLSLLVNNAPYVVARRELLIKVWGPEYQGDPGVLRLYVHALRRKLDDAGGDGNWIRNVPTVGYAFMVDQAA